MPVECDPAKRQATLDHRGLDVARADEVFAGAMITIEGDRQDYGEVRFITIGRLNGRMVVIGLDTARRGPPHHFVEEGRRLVDAIQWQIVIPLLCQPIWAWFCEAAWVAGQLPRTADKYMQPGGAIPVEWSPPKFDAVDPLKDAMADLLALRSGTMSLAQAIARQGHNPDAVLAEIAAMNAKLDELGLVLDSDPRRVTKTGVMQAAGNVQS
jgi:uncharacterized DUF497 family protein